MKKILITIIEMIIITGIIISLPTISKAAKGLTLKASNTNPEVGSTFTLTVGSGVGGRISMKSSNPSVVSVQEKQKIAYDSETFTLTAKAVGTTTITVTAVDLATNDDIPQKVTGSKSITINVKEKPQPKPEPPAEKPSNGGSNSSKLPASNKPNTNKDKVKDVKEVEQKEDATPQFGMNSLIINAIKENGEKQEITFEPTFNIDTYEYSCNISNDVKDLEILTEAGEYNDYVKVEKPEELVDGENIIKITMSKDDMNLTYTIKVNREAKIVEENKQEIENKESKSEENRIMITLTVTQFILIILSICIIEGVLLKMPWKKMFKKKE